MEHRTLNVERWRTLYRGLIAEGRVREVPVDRITDVIGNLLYGTIFTNYFSGQAKSVDVQAEDIIDIAFNGILNCASVRGAREGQTLSRVVFSQQQREQHGRPRALERHRRSRCGRFIAEINDGIKTPI